MSIVPRILVDTTIFTIETYHLISPMAAAVKATNDVFRVLEIHNGCLDRNYRCFR